MARESSRDFDLSPPWLLAVPLLVLGLVWYMTRATPVSSKRKPAKPVAKPAAPLPPASSAAPPAAAQPRVWVTPKKGQVYEPHFQAATAKYGLPAGLLSRVAARESFYNPDAISSAGAIGLMQIVPRFHPGVNPRDPIASIDYAAKFLKQLFGQFGSWTLAVAAYNAGAGNVRKYGGVPPFAETRAYVAAILPDVGIAQPEPGVRYA